MNNHYQIYLDSVITLAETMVIKFDDAAVALNDWLITQYGDAAVNQSDKSTWKYYQNISGNYHTSDTMIQVVSFDTGETINFTKENLAIHLATRDAYSFGTRHYKELLQNHPGQDLLIVGIINPVDIQVAINAKEGQILSYGADLVESNEYSLIPRLQTWIYQYLERWVNRQFAISDELYTASYIAQLFGLLVQAIITFRKQACKTAEVHSFHVQQYLASHSSLDVYLDKMTKAQALWFYRNILYIQRHAGKQDTLEWLIENIFTVRKLPMYAYTMKHNASNMGRDSLSDDRLLPEVEFTRKGINSYGLTNEIQTYSLDQVFAKMADLAKDNPSYQEVNGQTIRDEFALSESSTIATKLLECSARDYRDAEPYTLQDILFNHWLGMVARKTYLSTITVTLPSTGEVIQLAPQDAVAVFLYATFKTFGQTPDRIPSFGLSRLQRLAAPSFSELRSISDPAIVSDSEITQILSTRVAPQTIVSIQTFYDYCVSLQTAMLIQYRIFSSKDDHLARAQAQAITQRLYEDVLLSLPDLKDPQDASANLLYEDFFADRGLDFSAYSQDDFYSLAVNISAQATGINERKYITLAQLQEAMCNMFLKLTSYSIQVVQDVNTSAILIVDIPALRPGTRSVKEREQTLLYPKITPIDVADYTAHENALYTLPLIDLAKPKDPIEISVSDHAEVQTGVAVTVQQEFSPSQPYRVYLGMEVTPHWSVLEQTTNLTDIQRANIVDVYNEWPQRVQERLSRRLNGMVLISGQRYTLSTAHYYGPKKALPTISMYTPKKQLSGMTYYFVRRVLNLW